MNKASKGFTLIELVVVITILGILAAFAIPRFANLEVEARAAAVKGLGGSVRSGATLAHSLSLAKGLGPAVSVDMEGTTIAMANRYPTAASIRATLVDDEGFDFAGGVWSPTGVATPADCSVTYTAPGAGEAPTIDVVVDDCS